MLNYKLKIYDKLQYKNKTIKTIQKFGVGKTFLIYSPNSNIVQYYYNSK